jgi:hypothetical protein
MTPTDKPTTKPRTRRTKPAVERCPSPQVCGCSTDHASERAVPADWLPSRFTSSRATGTPFMDFEFLRALARCQVPGVPVAETLPKGDRARDLRQAACPGMSDERSKKLFADAMFVQVTQLENMEAGTGTLVNETTSIETHYTKGPRAVYGAISDWLGRAK